MMKSISLLKPSLNPKDLSNYHGSLSSNLSLFRVAEPGRALSFRLVPHARASGSGRSIWEEAAEEFFRAKGEKPATKESTREKKPYARTPGNKTGDQ
jgi:hypothetical protein